MSKKSVGIILAEIVSVVSHPMLYATYFAIVMPKVFCLPVFMTFLFTVLIPLFCIAIYVLISEKRSQKRTYYSFLEGGYVTNYNNIPVEKKSFFPKMTLERLSERCDDTQTRTVSLLITAVSSAIAGYFFAYSLLWTFVTIAVSLASIVCLLINNFWHMSIHSYGCGFMVSLVIVRFGFLLPYLDHKYLIVIGLVLFCGIVMTVRLYLGKHNNKQIYLGFLIGALIPALSMSYFL